mgnify:CR=1 FL=1
MKKFLSLVLALVMTMSLVTISAGAKDFTDADKVNYDEAIAVLSAVKVIDGYTDGSFKPQTQLNRGQAAKIICNLILGPTTAAELHATAAPFSDVPADNIFAGYIPYCANKGIIGGYADGTFRPDRHLPPAPFSVLLYPCLGLAESRYAGLSLPFADLDKIADYAVPAIKALYSEGVINGSKGKDGQIYFNPNAPLTRAQASAMIGRTQEKGYATVELTFTDAGKIPTYPKFYHQTMAAQGIIGGYTDGSFRPNNNITRGQMAKILYHLV